MLAVAVMSSGCAGFHVVERGDYQRVWVDSANRGATDPQTVITKDHWEEDLMQGNNRIWEAPPGWRSVALHESGPLGLQVGEVLELRVDESEPVDLQVDGKAIEVYWNPMKKKDDWKDHNDVTIRESRLLLLGKEAGVATLRLTHGTTTQDIAVTVKK